MFVKPFIYALLDLEIPTGRFMHSMRSRAWKRVIWGSQHYTLKGVVFNYTDPLLTG